MGVFLVVVLLALGIGVVVVVDGRAVHHGDVDVDILANATLEQRHLVYGGRLDDGGTLHIQTAYDLAANWTVFAPCVEWRRFWHHANLTEHAARNNETVVDVGGGQLINVTLLEHVHRPPSLYWITNQEEAESSGLPLLTALERRTNVSIETETVCGSYGRVLWLNTSEHALHTLGLGERHRELFCKPYELSLEPTQLMFDEFASVLRAFLFARIEQNRGRHVELVVASLYSENATSMQISHASMSEVLTEMHARLRAAADVKANVTIDKEDDDEFVTAGRRVRQIVDDDDEQWRHVAVLDNRTTDEDIYGDFEVVHPYEGEPVMYMHSNLAVLALGLRPTITFYRYPSVGIDLIGLCQGVVPRKDENVKDQELLGDDIVGGMQHLSFVNDTELSIFLRNDVRVDNIFELFKAEPTSLGATHMHFMFNRSQYDVRTAPIYYRDNPVKVRVGIYILSLSNFETNTMDYDMDVYLKMAWRDPRLMHEYSKPILIKDKEYLDQVWLPDPYFGNSKESEFHEVTVPNFLMRVFQKGEIYYEQRLKLTPSCNLVLCKYPHDKQSCSLTIGSYAYPTEELQFEWFSDPEQAVKIHPEVELPDLYIERITPVQCDGYRFGGNFT